MSSKEGTYHVRPTGYTLPDLLNKVKGFLIDDCLLGIFEYLPQIVIHIMAVCILEMLPGLEIDRMPKIFPAFQDGNDY